MKKLALMLAIAAGVIFAPVAARAEIAFNPNVLVVTSKPLYAPMKYKHGHQHQHQHQYRHHVKYVKQKYNYKKQCTPRYTPAYYRHHARPVVWWYK